MVASAVREDRLPFYYVAGADLTDLAEAVRMAPQIAARLRPVWIGRPGAPEAATPRPAPLEYNLAIDVAAARTLFIDSSVEIWQVSPTTCRSMIRCGSTPASTPRLTFADMFAKLRRASR